MPNGRKQSYFSSFFNVLGLNHIFFGDDDYNKNLRHSNFHNKNTQHLGFFPLHLSSEKYINRSAVDFTEAHYDKRREVKSHQQQILRRNFYYNLTKMIDSVYMYQQRLKQLKKALANWSTADVRTVPGVMYQIRCGTDENDPNLEYQINWFIDCTETFIHNHRHSFYTLCLEGGYKETLWAIDENDTSAITYQHYRKPGNIFDSPTEVPGALRPVQSRHHYPGNLMHVGTNQNHSIARVSSADSPPFTFLAKRSHSPTPDMYVLSSSPVISAPNDEIQPATEVERQNMYNKLQQILKTKFQ